MTQENERSTGLYREEEVGGVQESHRERRKVEKIAFKAFTILPQGMDLDFCPPIYVIFRVASMASNRACTQEYKVRLAALKRTHVGGGKGGACKPALS